MYIQPQPPEKSVNLNSFEIWWSNLLPTSVKNIMPHWLVSSGIVTALAILSGSELAISMVSLYWASMIFTLIFRAFKAQLGRHKWLIMAYHALLGTMIASPVMAQEGAAVCTNTGLFSDVTNFIQGVFGAVTFGGLGGGSLSALICQTIGLLTVGLLLGFLGVLGTVSYQVGYQRQPIAAVLDPVFGFLIFAGGASFVIGIMLGTGGTTTGVGA